MKITLSTSIRRNGGNRQISLFGHYVIPSEKLVLAWLVLLLSLAQPIFAKSPSARALVSPDYQPLVDLYNTTNGPSWTNNSGWITGDSPCGWFGVICNPNGRVLSVDLHNNNLTGILPTTLPQLTRLKVFNVTNNNLSGTIPLNIGQISNLQLLYLGRNSFTGILPTSLSMLSELLLLDVSHNQLVGTVLPGLSALSKVKQLSLSFNNFTGTIPTSLSQLANLQVLYLNNNNLTGTIPNELSMLAKLQLLELSRNQLSGGIPASLGNLSNLLLLYLNNNNLTGSIPASLGNLSILQYLYLQKNQLSGCLPSSLTVFCGRTVDISGNPGLPGGGDFDAFCNSGAGKCMDETINVGSGRKAVGIEELGLQVAVQGNPVVGSELIVEVRGAEGQPLTFQLHDLSGKVVNTHQIEQAEDIEKLSMPINHLSVGQLLLRVSSPTQTQTVKVMKSK